MCKNTSILLGGGHNSGRGFVCGSACVGGWGGGGGLVRQMHYVKMPMQLQVNMLLNTYEEVKAGFNLTAHLSGPHRPPNPTPLTDDSFIISDGKPNSSCTSAGAHMDGAAVSDKLPDGATENFY